MATARPARLIPADGGTVLPCTVRDISLTGARLETVEPVEADQRFNLHFDGSDETYLCRVVWRKENQVGVVFE
jgi:hypothetical protein